MASVVEICNMALSQLGNATIQSLDEASNEAKYCKLHYAQARQAALSAHAWNFAVKRAYLAQVSGFEDDYYEYAYTKPSKCLRVLKILPETLDNPNEFVVHEKNILCNVEDAQAEYISDIEDVNSFDALFIDALVYKLAERIAIPLTGQVDAKTSFQQLYMQALGIARSHDSTERRESKKETFMGSRN